MSIKTLESITEGNGLISDGDWIESKDQDPAGTIRLIQLADIGDGRFLNKSQRFVNEETLQRLNCTLLHEGDVLIARMPDPLGRTCVFPKLEQRAITAVDVCIVRPAPHVVNSEWLSFRLNAEDLRAEIQSHAQGATRARVPTGKLKGISFDLPAFDEQLRVAARLKAQLAEVETARQAAQAQVHESAALRAAIYRDAFHQVAPVIVPPSFPDAPPGWRWRKLKELARLESGHTPSRSRPDWWGGDVSWISLTEIRALDGTWVEQTQLRTNDQGIANSAARILPRGTVCFSRTASVGFVTIMAAPMATSQDFANWVCSNELDSEFLMHALIRSRKELRELATGATHKTIYMPTLEAFHLCTPHIDEQRSIVARLKAQLAEADAIAQAAATQLAEIERLPQKLLAQAFHAQGEVR